MKFYKFISYFFHPINFPIIGTFLFFLFIPKYIFKPQEYNVLAITFIGTYLFPMVLLTMLKKFKLINSFHMVTIQERRFPILLFTSLSLIIGNLLLKYSNINLLALFFFGYAIGLIAIYSLLFKKLKISLHSFAIGGLIGFLICFSYYYKINLILLLAILFILSGVIATSRLKLNVHALKEVIYGFLIGISTQLILILVYII